MVKKVVKVREYKKLDLRGGILFDGFPSIGLVSTILANYYIASYNLDSIAVIDSPVFPPITTIYAGKPKFPARIHADENLKFAVISSEFTPHPSLDREIGLSIFKWAIKHGISKIITIEGILEEKDVDEACKVWVVGSTSKSIEDIKKAELPMLEYGAIMGIPAIILNECKFANIDAYCFVAKVHHTHPEFKASAKVLEMINKLIPKISLDPKPLYEEAEKIEKKLKEVREHIKPVEAPIGLFYR